MMTELGRLEEIKDLRSVWKNEATDFTPWLAANIWQLGEELGIDIEVDGTESSIGAFSVDIFAHDAEDGKNIIIENQLEDTDHDHLGKLITYASGKNAELVIWIVRHAREEHRFAIEWLNAHTDEEIGFVLCELKLYRIGNSSPAPKFVVLERPNDWAKGMRRTTGAVVRTRLPRIVDMLHWGVVGAGDKLSARGRESIVTLKESGHVDFNGEDTTLHNWLHNVYGWSSVETYRNTVHVPTGKTLSQLRSEYMDAHPDAFMTVN